MKRKHRLLLFIFSLMAILLVFGVLLSFGLFTKHPIEIAEPASPQEPHITPNTRLVRDVTATLPGKAYCSEPMDGVLLDLPRDIPSSDTEQAVLSSLYQAFLWYRNCGTDTIFIRPDLTGRFGALQTENGAAFDLTACAVSYAQMYGYYTVLAIGDEPLEQDGRFDFSAVSDLLVRYGFDALYYESSSGVTDGAALRTAEQIRSAVDAEGARVSFGCAVYSQPSLLSGNDSGFTVFFAADTADFVCVCPGSLTGASVFSFAEEMAGWNAFAARWPDTVFYCAYQLEDILTASSPGGEIERQMETMFEQEQFRGGVYGPSGALLRSLSVTRQISRFYYREDKYDFAVDSMSITEDGSAVVFGGKAVAGRKLLIDRTVIAPDGGPFSVTCALADGVNRYLLRNAGYANAFTVEKVADAPAGTRPSPYGDNGSGRALMCRVDHDLTQAVSVAGDYDTYHPDFSDLPAGTLDYVRAITFDEGIRYELASGLSVSAWDATLLSNAYAMPENTVSLKQTRDDDPRCTQLVFGTDWTVPVTLTLSAQPYHKGYLRFSYNIDSFSAAYLDVIFHHTARFVRADQLRFGPDSVIARGETLQNEDGQTVLRLYLKDPSVFCGASVSADLNGNLTVSVKKRASALSGAKVMLDPGHGGVYMTGTALNDESLSEKDVTLNISLKVRDLLRAQGIDVRMTREADVSLTLRERKELCMEYRPDVFVSIHCDGVDDMGESGTHSFYYKPYSQPLAACVHRKLVDVYSSVIYTSIDRNYDQIDKSIKYYPFYVTRVDDCPSILVESGFMSNDYEGRILADENCRMWIADAIAAGIVDYLNGNFVVD